MSDNWLLISYIIVAENFMLLQSHALIIEGPYRVPQFKTFVSISIILLEQ